MFSRYLQDGIELLSYCLAQSNMVLGWMCGLQLVYLLSSYYAGLSCRWSIPSCFVWLNYIVRNYTLFAVDCGCIYLSATRTLLFFLKITLSYHIRYIFVSNISLTKMYPSDSFMVNWMSLDEVLFIIFMEAWIDVIYFSWFSQINCAWQKFFLF